MSYFFGAIVIIFCASSSVKCETNSELISMFRDLKNLVKNLDKSYFDVLTQISNQESLKPIWLQIQMLRQYLSDYELNPENHSLQSLDDQILNLKSDVENSELIVANLLLFNQVRLDPKLSSIFHQVQFSLRALHYHVNTVAQYLYNSWQSQTISDPYKENKAEIA